MRIVIAGGSGFLGTALTAALLNDRHDVVILTRQSPLPRGDSRRTFVTWTPDGGAGSWSTALDAADAVINLAGESIAAKRWSEEQKRRIRDSRLLATRSLTTVIRQSSRPPGVLISGSAVGYYGDRGDDTLTETSPPGRDFLADVSRAWEEAAAAVSDISRVALIRTGIVLDRHGGALQKMLPPFRMFVGGPLGSGQQFMPGSTRWTGSAWLCGR